MRSTISSRSNSASPAKIANTSRLLAVVVSIDAPSPASTLSLNLALGEVANQIDKMAKIAAEPVELPDDQRVAASQRLDDGIKARPVVAPSRGAVLIDMLGRDPGRGERVALQVMDLAAVRLGHPSVTDLRHINVRSRDAAALPVDRSPSCHITRLVVYAP